MTKQGGLCTKRRILRTKEGLSIINYELRGTVQRCRGKKIFAPICGVCYGVDYCSEGTEYW
jgi:cytochrome c